MHSAHVAGRAGFGRLYRTKKITKPMAMMTQAKINRPAGRIHGNQSGTRLGIWRLVLRFRGAAEVSTASYHAI
jgi:hypothetical protein